MVSKNEGGGDRIHEVLSGRTESAVEALAIKEEGGWRWQQRNKEIERMKLLMEVATSRTVGKLRE